MSRSLVSFKDILEPRRQESSNFMWISRELHSVVAYKQTVKPSPKWHKQQVLNSPKIQEIIRKMQEAQGIPKEQLEQQIQLILDEIGFNKRLSIIRWLGLLLTKICLKVCASISVNEDSFLRLRRLMGNTPIVFLPSHRSYADFILMAYVCFQYDIELPAVAAGMDFHGMWGMGTVLRDTGAFFMRRSFNNDDLYWDTFRQYILQLITQGDLPIEFFIEGTRSRSAKSLSPKFGLLSMVLKPFFTSEVPDILFVPINISYDRVLEEKLFAYELLGVPKPKESTSAFFKSLSIVKERYGNIYFDFGEPISARKYFSNRMNRSVHNMKPIHMQELTQQEKDLTSELAYDIVYAQQKLSVINAFNLIALSLTNNFMLERKRVRLDEVLEDVTEFKSVLEKMGILTNVINVKNDVLSALNIHKGLVQINQDLTLSLVKNSVVMANTDLSKLKGHNLSQGTMTFVVPFIMLQIYVNPVLHYLVNLGILVVILEHCGRLRKDVLYEHFAFLRLLLSYEFVAAERRENSDFHEAIEHLKNVNVISSEVDQEYFLSDNQKLKQLLYNILEPFIFVYHTVCQVLTQITNPSTEKSIIITSQAQLESIIHKSGTFIHPYCLNLDTLTICLHSLTTMCALKKEKINEEMMCQVDYTMLNSIIRKLEMYLQSKPKEADLQVAKTKPCLESKL